MVKVNRWTEDLQQGIMEQITEQWERQEGMELELFGFRFEGTGSVGILYREKVDKYGEPTPDGEYYYGTICR